jgi:integrase
VNAIILQRGALPPQLLPFDQQPSRVYLSTLALGSRRTMAAALELLAAVISEGMSWPAVGAHELPWHLLRFNHTQAAATELSSAARGLAPGYVKKIISALRGVLKTAWKLGQMTAEDYHRAVEIKLPRAGRALLSGRALEVDEMALLLGALEQDTRPVARRDAALVALLFTVGLRRSEAATLDLADLDIATQTVKVCHGKGNKAREVPVSPSVWPLLEAWLRVRGNEPGALFCPQASSMEPDSFAQRHLTDQAVYVIMRRLAKRAGVARFSPHDLRRSAATHMIEAGGNIASIARVMGHTSTDQSARYDRSGVAAMRRVVATVRLTPEATP